MSTKEHLAKQSEKITKEWHKDLRWATLAPHCVWCSAGVMKLARLAVKSDPLWTHRFIELCRRMHKNQAIVAIARRLVELVWYVLSRKQAYRNFSHERIAYKYLTWSWQLNDKDRDGLTRQQFTHYYLMKLGIGHDLERIALNPRYQRGLASEAEVLTLRPELTQTE